jgi:hypothetical protein
MGVLDMIRLFDNEDGTRSFPHHALGNAAHQQSPKSGAAMGCHDDQLSLFASCELDDLDNGYALQVVVLVPHMGDPRHDLCESLTYHRAILQLRWLYVA